jgi:tetratricopeptide (TPR) repeat protein
VWVAKAIDIAHGAGIDKVGLMTAKVEAGIRCASWRCALLAAVLISLPILGTGCQKLQARDHLNKGVTAFKNAQYPEAVEHFKQAVELDPNYPIARLYLATAYMQQYIPGVDSDGE